MEHQEQWKPVTGFPDYQVSSAGRIFGDLSGTMLKPSLNSTGNVKVILMLDKQPYTRAVRTLVAEAFVAGMDDFDNATPINLNGDHWDNRADNLMWRPRWFAWKYTQQFAIDPPPEYEVPIWIPKTQRSFESTLEAGITDGVLWEYIYQSILTGRPVFPTGSVYAFKP